MKTFIFIFIRPGRSSQKSVPEYISILGKKYKTKIHKATKETSGKALKKFSKVSALVYLLYKATIETIFEN